MNSKKAKQARREAREKQGNSKATTCYFVEAAPQGMVRWEVGLALRNYRALAQGAATDDNYPQSQLQAKKCLLACHELEQVAQRSLSEAGGYMQERIPHDSLMDAAVRWATNGIEVPTDAEAFYRLHEEHIGPLPPHSRR